MGGGAEEEVGEGEGLKDTGLADGGLISFESE